MEVRVLAQGQPSYGTPGQNMLRGLLNEPTMAV